MNFIYKIMGVDKKPDDKYKYIWFTMGTACFALATLVMTIVISRLLGETQAGMFSVGLSIAQWLVTIAYFEIRTFQVTDVRNEYTHLPKNLCGRNQTSRSMLIRCIMRNNGQT